jgi:enoyl-CoA hydratase/carnithine racemase
MSVEQDLLFDVTDNVAVITLNRPEQRNAFTDEMVARWVDLLNECDSRDDVRVIVFTANGSSFCAGADTGRMAGNSAQSPVQVRDRMTNVAHALVRAVAKQRKPVIAAVNGAAVGGGMDVALMCDVRLASTKARFAETYAKMGLLPGVGGAWFLPRLIGQSKAFDMFWTGRWVEIDEAQSLGIVDRVFSEEEFYASVMDYARTVADAAPLSVKAIKTLIKHGANETLHAHLDNLAAQLAVVRTSEDHKEALAAFKEKRKPVFSGN